MYTDNSELCQARHVVVKKQNREKPKENKTAKLAKPQRSTEEYRTTTIPSPFARSAPLRLNLIVRNILILQAKTLRKSHKDL